MSKVKTNKVGRPRGKSSTSSLGHMGLSPEEDIKLAALLKTKQRSLLFIQRYLIREWMKQQGDPTSGVLKLNKY